MLPSAGIPTRRLWLTNSCCHAVQLEALPSAHVYVGRTNLSIDDIRAWNSMHRREYELHVNDCRHYVNCLVKYTTGEVQVQS